MKAKEQINSAVILISYKEDQLIQASDEAASMIELVRVTVVKRLISI